MNAHNGSRAAGSRPAVRDREDVLVDRLGGLGSALDREPDPAFRAATRARLVAMAAVRTPEPARPVESLGARWRGRLTAGLAGAAVAVTALAALVGVSAGAQPGDPLYGLKRGTEQTQLALAGDSSRGQTLLDFASTRRGELEHLLSEGTTALPAVPAGSDDETVLAAGASPELVIQTLRTMDAQTTEGTEWLTTRSVDTASGGPLDDLLSWASGQSEGLSALVSRVPEGARDQMASSLALLTAVSARGTALEDVLTCPAGPATSGTDGLGPVPATCGDVAPSAPSAGGGTGGEPGTGPSSGSSATDLPSAGVPAGPTPGTGSSSSGVGGGSSASTRTPTAPSVPGVTPSLPLPSLPVPSIPVPGLPGTNPGAGTSPATGSTPAASSPPIIDTPLPICLPPIIC